MTNINEIRNELVARGYGEVIVSDVVKNSVKMTGLTIKKDKDDIIAPCVYITEELANLENAQVACDVIERHLARSQSPDIRDPLELISKDNILSKVMIGVQRSSTQALIKRSTEYDGIEQFLYIGGDNSDGSNWKIKLNQRLLDEAGLTKDEVWERAEANTFSDENICIQSMLDVFKAILGPLGDLSGFDVPMYIVSNKKRSNGAVQIFNKKAIRSWAKDHGFNSFYMLPSSVHEVIIVPVDLCAQNFEFLNAMVRGVNADEVDPVDQLSDKAYLLNMAS